MKTLINLYIFSGLAMIAYGLSLWSVALAWIFAGFMLLTVGCLVAIGYREQEKKKKVLAHASSDEGRG